MKTIDQLNLEFGTNTDISFRKLADNIAIADINNSLASASVSLYGGHVVSWQPKTQTKPVLWVSDLVKFQQGKAIRGGVPICWPWFGAHQSQASLPGHGYARITPWVLTSVQTMTNGATILELSLGKSDLFYAHWHANVRLTLRVTIGDTLEITLKTLNETEHEFTFTEGLHTYFQVSDIANIRILGLEGCEYIDLLNQNERCTQAAAISFNDHLGRIYLNSQAACVIEDPKFQRRIRIEKSGSNSTAVWNPGQIVASTINDMGPSGWRNMVCVESANALQNAVKVLPGFTHEHNAFYSVEKFDQT